jgi:hypothetical protein
VTGGGRLAAVVLGVALAGAVGLSRSAQGQPATTQLTPQQRERERKAMSAFAATRYQEALDMYADLYADFHDPIYLRNIGRCHYKLKHPEEAISSFQDYLAKYKRLTAREIDEVQGWIADMKELQAKAAPPPARAAPPPATTTAPPPPGPRAPVPVAPPVATVTPPPPPAVRLSEKAPPPAEPARANTTLRRVGVGALIAGAALVVPGVVFAASSWSKFNDAKDGKCLGTSEGCQKAADAIDRRATLSKIFFVSGVAAAVSGATILIFFPATEPRGPAAMEVGVGVTGTF